MVQTKTYNQMIEGIVKDIVPFDEEEACHKSDVLEWIRSGSPLCCVAKPDNPPKHLVSYFTLFEPKERRILLVDHRKACLWLPPGGHVDPGEHPKEAALRELKEELGVTLSLFSENPIFLTVTETVGLTAGHIDVSLWYVFKANSSRKFSYDKSEFNQIKWFSIDNLPLKRTDPHLLRFCKKFTSHKGLRKHYE